jgi:acyl carrier protein
MNEMREKVRAFVVDTFLYGEGDGLMNESSFLDEGIIDSTGILELVAFLEDNFSITVEDEELIPENLDSLDNITAFLGKKISSASSGFGTPSMASA